MTSKYVNLIDFLQRVCYHQKFIKGYSPLSVDPGSSNLRSVVPNLGLITDDKITEVRERVDIVQIVGEYVRLVPSGREYKALCPFHQEKTPSFYVVPQKQIFHCFGCGKGGGVFKFLMETEGTTFPESVRLLARRCGVEIPDECDLDSEQRSGFYDLLESAASFFSAQLMDSSRGRAAREYLQARGLDPSGEILSSFRLGFAPDSWDSLCKRAGKTREAVANLVSMGLIKPRQEGDGYYDTFRHRLMVPIVDLRGRVAAFGGRVIKSGDEPKYLNSPESVVFNKSRLLFNLHSAMPTIRRLDAAIVVEGYLDVISLVSHGFKNVVATLGTAITPDHMHLLARNCKTVYFCYDADHAGQKAMLKAVTLQRDTHLEACMITFGETKDDPESFIRREGSAAFQSLLDNALDMYTFLIETRTKGLNPPLEIHVKERLINEFKDLIPSVESPVAKSEVIRKISRLLDMDPYLLERQFENTDRGARSKADPPLVSKPGSSTGNRRQEWVLKHLLEHPHEIEKVCALLSPADFSDPRLRKLFEIIAQKQEAADGTLKPAQILATLDDSELVSRVSELLVTLEERPAEPFMQCVKLMVIDRMKHEAEEIQKKIRRAEHGGDSGEIGRLTMAQVELRRKIDLLSKNS